LFIAAAQSIRRPQTLNGGLEDLEVGFAFVGPDSQLCGRVLAGHIGSHLVDHLFDHT
jgi:hypothetical protein